jgi:hypothetical protein
LWEPSGGDQLEIEGLAFDVIYTPGHTDDSYCFLCSDRVFTGARLQRRYCHHDCRGASLQSASARKVTAGIVDLMSSLHLTNPKMMDVALPANTHQGLSREVIARRG